MPKSSKILWKSPALPKKFLEDDGLMWSLFEKAGQEECSDAPDTNALRACFRRYNESNVAERDAMDEVFVLFTGYTLHSLSEMLPIVRKSDRR